MIKNKKLFVIRNVVLAIVLAVVIVLNMVAVYWSEALLQVFGYVGGEKVDASQGGSNIYFLSEYNETDLRSAQHDLAHRIGSEGAVLLKNDNAALPLSSGANVTVFSEASTEWLINGTGSSAIGTEDYLYVNVKWSLEQAGLNVNETVWNWYRDNGVVRGGGSATGDWSVNESSWETVTGAVGSNAFDGYKDAAIVVIGRTGGEGADLAVSMEAFGGSADESYLSVTEEEKSILSGAKEAGFDKIIVIINSANPVEMDFLREYDVDACLLVGPTGAYGLEALGHVLVGNENPSGHLTDTQVYDVFSSAAMQNFGNSRYVDASGSPYGNRYNYVAYNEGIYVGYRYYETRYEDSVMGTANVGSFSYEDEVAFPFGYGLSYTDFQWSNYTMSESDGVITVSVDVSNTGSAPGKDVVEVYFQSPYTDYDKTNAVEKAAVELAAFAKTSELAPGASETVTVTFNVNDMKAYDYTTAKTYIMDEGDYYITAAQDAHQAVDNILSAKGYTAPGDAAMTGVHHEDAFQALGTDAVTGTAIVNQFDDASAEDSNYLTRQNWAMMDSNGIAYSTGTYDDNGTVYPTHFASSELIAHIDDQTWESSGRPAEADDNTDIVVGQDHGMELIELMGAEFDDPRWDTLLEQVKISEMHTMWNKGGYTTSVIESINKPMAPSTDGPAGLAMFMSGWGCFNYCTEFLLACTWNEDLAAEMGKLVGEDSLHSNIAGWYAPAMNIHRTPFGGRCFEYFSEDPHLSGVLGAAICQNAVSKGLITYIKHFALNDQDTNRNSICTWSNEQAIREIYLQPFEITVKTSDCNGLMSSYNNIGYRTAKGHYPLLTSVLRDEWGFGGVVITDLATFSGTANDMSLAAGVDLQLTTGVNELSTTKENRIRNALKLATKRVCYAVVNSSAMNGMEGGKGMISSGTPTYIFMLVAIDVIAALGLAAAEFLTIRKCRVEAPVLTEEEQKKQRQRAIIKTVVTLVIIAAILVGAVLYINSQMIGESIFDYIFH